MKILVRIWNETGEGIVDLFWIKQPQPGIERRLRALGYGKTAATATLDIRAMKI